MEAVSPQPTMMQSPQVHDHSPGLSSVIERNIATLLERQRAEQRRSLLAEHEITRLITTVSALARKAGVDSPSRRNYPIFRRTSH
jgi:hypothetical protein